MGMEVISGDIIQTTDKAFLFAINGDPDDTIWIPLSVVEETETDELVAEANVELLVSSWWYNKHKDRF